MGDFDSIYIEGAWRAARGSESIPIINPFTEARIDVVRAASAEDIDDMVQSSYRAMRTGPWSRYSLDERIAVVERIKTGLMARRDDLIEKAVLTLGQPLSRARQVSRPEAPIDNAIRTIRGLALEFRREDPTGVALISRRPVGVVAVICPYNAPTLMELLKTIPALLAGCAVVLKPDPQTPYAARILAEVADEAGLPPGVLNVAFGGGPTGDALVRHPLVRLVTFTGSSATGSIIASACSTDFKRTVLELGGKSALIMLEDADFDAAIAAADVGNFRNAGQACIGLSRILVPRARYTEVVDRLAARAQAYVLGNPFDEATTMGPVVSKRQQERIFGLIDTARNEGGRIVTGGKRPEHLPTGWFVEPTVVADVGPSATIAQMEVFGPVATVIPFDGEAHAVAIANDSQYGLSGSVFSSDPDRALAIARQIDTGTVGINCYGHTEAIPFGGVKRSGIGREHGPEGFDAFLEYASYTLELGAGAVTAAAPPARPS